jgi:serine protease Do
VEDVTPDGPSDGKLKPEDVIVSLDGQPVGYASELQAKVAEHHPGDEVKLEVYRKGDKNNPIQVTVKLGEAPINDRTAKTATAEVHAEDRLGINVQPLDDSLAQRLGYKKGGGVVISAVAQASPADQRRVPVGIKLLSVNDTPVSTPADVRRALEKVKGGDIVSLHLEDQQDVARVINIRMPG